MPVKEAAQRLGCSERMIRSGLRQGRFSWGFAVKGKRWSYYISAEKFEEEERCLKQSDS